MPMLLEKRLIMRFNRGDISAVRDIYALYKDDLVSLAAVLLQDRTHAEDIVHDVFAGLVQKQEALRISKNLRAYLFTSVTNRIRQHMRKNDRRGASATDLGDDIQISAQKAPECWLILDEQKRDLTQALAKLPYEQREVIMLRHYSDFRFKRIAATQNVSVNTVQGRYRYGMEKLRSLLNGEQIQ